MRYYDITPEHKRIPLSLVSLTLVENVCDVTLCLYLFAGDPAGDGHPGARAGTGAPVLSMWKTHPASAHEGAQIQRDRERARLHGQRPVHLQTAQSKDPDRYRSHAYTRFIRDDFRDVTIHCIHNAMRFMMFMTS